MNIFATHRNPIKAANWLWDLDKVRGRKGLKKQKISQQNLF